MPHGANLAGFHFITCAITPPAPVPHDEEIPARVEDVIHPEPS
jgi:hypothetical protein